MENNFYAFLSLLVMINQWKIREGNHCWPGAVSCNFLLVVGCCLRDGLVLFLGGFHFFCNFMFFLVNKLSLPFQNNKNA